MAEQNKPDFIFNRPCYDQLLCSSKSFKLWLKNRTEILHPKAEPALVGKGGRIRHEQRIHLHHQKSQVVVAKVKGNA